LFLGRVIEEMGYISKWDPLHLPLSVPLERRGHGRNWVLLLLGNGGDWRDILFVALIL